jgi:hypothetical protein
MCSSATGYRLAQPRLISHAAVKTAARPARTPASATSAAGRPSVSSSCVGVRPRPERSRRWRAPPRTWGPRRPHRRAEPPDAKVTAARARAEGVPAAPASTFASSRPVGVGHLAPGDGDRLGPGVVGTVTRPLSSVLTARHRPQLPLPPHRRDLHPPVRRAAAAASQHARVGHPDDPRAAGAGEGGGTGRRRRQPPWLPVGLRAHQGQPPGRPDDRRRRGGPAVAGPGGGVGATGSTRSPRRSPPGVAVLCDNDAAEVTRVYHRRRPGPDRVSGGVASTRCRLRRRRGRPHLHQRHPSRPRLSTSGSTGGTG